MRRSLGLSAAALLLTSAVAASAGPPSETETQRIDVPLEELTEPFEEWYGIYANEDKLGYLKNSIRPDTSGEGSFEVINEMHLKVVTLGQKREVRSVESYDFAGEAPHRLRGGTSVIDQGPYRQKIELTAEDGRWEAGRYEARVVAADSERRLEITDLDYTLADILTPELWFREPRQPGEVLTTRSFSLSDLTPAVDTYSVEGIRQTLVDGVAVSYYEVDLHSSVAGEIGTALFDRTGTLISGIIGGAFELRKEPPELATDFDYSADVYLLGMAEVDQALGDPRSVNTLVLEVEGIDPAKIGASERQRMDRDEESGTWTLSLGAGVGEPVWATDEEIDEALVESVEYPINEPEIVQLAREAVGEAETAGEKVERLVAFVDEYLVDSYSEEPLTVLDMLSSRKGDCTEHALLFTTLARSLDIPTREVTGLLYLGDDVRAFGGHAWNEVVLDGQWRAVDATWGETDINATHIRLGPRSGSDASTTALFGNYSFTVVDIER